MNEKEQQKKIAILIGKLHSAKETDILSALTALRDIPSGEAIKPIALLLNHKSPNIVDEAKLFLLDLKKDIALLPIIEAIKKEENTENKNFLISLLWNTPLDASEHLLVIVELLRIDNYMTRFEILTVIEDLRGPFANEEKEEAIFILYEIKESTNDEHTQLLFHQIEKVLKALPTDEF